MVATLVQCPKCRVELLEERLFNQNTMALCRGCGSRLQVEVFPAYFRKNEAAIESEASLVEGESTCYYHATKRAVVPCHGCGRFLCALCDCELHGQHYCPICLEAGKTKGKIRNLQNSRTRWDSIALALAVYPVITIVFWVFSFVTAPMALFIAIRYWNAPRSIFHRTKTRLVLAIVFSSLEIFMWAVGIYYLIRNGQSG